MSPKPSAEELKAAAESAIAARAKATEAKQAADAAGGTDEELTRAATEAEGLAKDAEAKAAALSQPKLDDKQVEKLRRKKGYIERALKEAGVDEDDDEDEDDEDYLERPVTVADLQRKTAQEQVDAIQDPAEREAVRKALEEDVNPSLVLKDPKAAVAKAVSIANAERNSKIIEESRRKGQVTQHRNGAGAPPKPTEDFEPTAEEQRYMHAPFNLTKEEILKARG